MSSVLVTNVSYKLGFPCWYLCIYGSSAKVINPMVKKQSPVTNSTDQENKVSPIYISLGVNRDWEGIKDLTSSEMAVD